MLGASSIVGAIPFSNLAARAAAGVDLRDVGSGTVSGTALHRVAGFGPLAVAGILDIAKGTVGPLLASPRRRPGLAALAGGAAVAGHNWSPFLGFAGGRGISPAIGALLVTAPAGGALLLGGLAAGRLARHTGLGSLMADALLVPVAAGVHGRRGAQAAAAVLVPLLLKRVAGNAPAPRGRRLEVWRNRLLFDRDTPTAEKE